MESEEYDILWPNKGNAPLEGSSTLNYNVFINGLLNSPSTTQQDRERIVELLLKERDKGYVTEEQVKKMIEEYGGKKRFVDNTNSNRDLSPKRTADFMSLFNDGDGLKYLTHNYDSSKMTLESMLNQAKKVFKEQAAAISIPKQLWTLINAFLNGGEWIDYRDSKCQEGYSTKSWLEWSKQNDNRHPKEDIDGMDKTIQRFRHTIRIVSPDLQTMIKEIVKPFEKQFKFDFLQLDKADFYTHVEYIKHRIIEIVKDLTDHDTHKEIHFLYQPGLDGDYYTRTIRITQSDSFSSKSLEEVIDRFNSGAGFFADNAIKLRGYCNWSVESLWDGKPYRWNIVAEEGTNKKEEIAKEAVSGFTHILTFYYID